MAGAWSYRFRNDPGPYARQETRARSARVGLWGTGDAEIPRNAQIGDGQRARRVSVLLGHDREIHMGAAHFGSEQRQKTRFRRMRDRRWVDGDGSRVQRRADSGDGVVPGEPGTLRGGELLLFVGQAEVHSIPFY